MFTARILRAACSLAALFAALTLPALGLDPHKELRSFNYQSWQTDSGLPQNTVHAVLQTRDGYLWFATEAGLVRYDGAQFAVYDRQNTPGLAGDVINGLTQDSAGTLWISTAAGLTSFRDGVFRSYTAQDGLPASTVWRTFEGRTGELWAVTAGGLARLSHGRWTAFPVAQGLEDADPVLQAPDGTIWVGTISGLIRLSPAGHAQALLDASQVQSLAQDNAGRLWVGTRTGLVLIEKDGAVHPFALPATDITALLPDDEGRLWIGAGKGLWLWNGHALRGYSAQDGLPSDAITRLYEDHRHTLWIATSRGIARLADGSLQSFTARQGLSGNSVLAFLEDREGDLWLGTESGGVGVLRDRKFTTYTSQEGLSDDLARAIYQDRRGGMWVGTNGGGLNRWNGKGFTALTTASGLSSNIVLALADDASGDLWVGTPDGLDRLRNGHATAFTSADGLADDFVRSLTTDSRGALWIGTRRGLTHYADGQFQSYSSLDGLGSDLVGALLADRDGSLWIGTLGGLTHYVRGHFTNITTANGLSSNIITALYQDPAGTLWIGTSGGGLDRLAAGHVTAYPPASGGLPPNIYSILEDSGNHLWLSSNKGIFRVSKAALDRFAAGQDSSVAIDAYGTADGMKISECSSGGHPAAAKRVDGSMWFATLRGVATVNPEQMAINHVPPLVAIEQVSIDDRALSGGELARVSPGGSRFAFQYAGLSFVAPQKVHFRYKLDGFDRHWIDAGSRRVAYYTNIPPGRYTFRVAAANNDGIWSERDAAVSFRLMPHFYQTYWFDLALLLAAILFGYELYRRRVRRVEQQFTAVMAERNRIAREIHDTLAQGFVAVSVQLEIVSRVLASSTETAKAHLDEARSLVRHCLDEARSSIWDLRSQNASQEDLVARLKRVAAHVIGTAPVEMRVKVEGSYRPLPPQVERELVRIAQEAMTNAIRHGHPGRIDLLLRFETARFEMKVHDDGRGFSGGALSAGPDGHFGVTGMKERAREIGGELSIVSEPGHGTEVVVSLPID
ncbi:sensor histidine kinase [Acidipila rosea]|uniref:Signal transduction histidine kinase n=1 Tax=Acidipila rosea TaxID=768535 RepID=A0A4R1L175_9BACT|nr:sensor histidine kinase [Acidipila rosea]TCK71584.1 signal transduction histidine kinase [Acidipila rosea]